MAEEFVIRVQVEDLQGRGAQPRTGAGAQQNNGASPNNPALAEMQGRIRKLNSRTGLDAYAHDERITKKMVGKTAENPDWKDAELLNRGLVKGTYGTRRRVDITEGLDTIHSQEQETAFGALISGSAEHGVAGFLNQHRARIRATGTIAINSLIQSQINMATHRSGDSYRNQKMANTASAGSSLASVGIAGAIWGPTAAVAFAANFAISTGFSLHTQNANYKFDRMMDTHYIHNIEQVAGDVSYGRVRGGR